MINYVLDWCQTAFFKKIIVLSQEESNEDIKKEIENYKKQKSEELANSSDPNDVYETPIEIVSMSCENSGEVFYNLFKDPKIKLSIDNFIALPCDFITDLPPQVLIERFRNRRDEDLGIYVSYKNQLDIEDKKSKIFGKSYTIYSNEDDSSFLDLYNKEEVDHSKILQIRMQMCQRFPNSTLSTKLLNSGIFLGSNKIFDIINEENSKFNESYFERRNFQKFIRDLARRSWKHSNLKETIGFMEIPSQATFFRVNKLPVWMEANRHFMKQQAMSKGQAHQQQKDKSSAHVGNDSTVGENTTLGEKTNVKRSVIGSNCKIGNKVRITGCLILDNVTIEDDVQLDNCIVGHDVTIHSKSKLTNCNIESTNEVISGTQSKGDTLLCLSLENLEDGESEEEFVLQEGPLSDSSSEEEEEDDDESEDESEFEDEYTGNEDGLFDY
ncbi:GCD1 [Candida jiufengensis]|uniref:GCD1 n=1 Tax=Candida jiufengensis TaxID=497108 RepID=UPI0022242F7C|nr:GCD1 [Candida jiufengensis]KAI5954607.1 GCD1 [Candida jiufengensis]